MSGIDDDRPISLILDTSAVLAFAAGSMHVHEPVIVAGEAGEHVGVPVTCLLEAVRRDPHAELHELLHHPRIVSCLTRPTRTCCWTGPCTTTAGRTARLPPVASYRRGHCSVLTGEPDLYVIGGRRPEWVIPIDGKTPPDRWDIAE